MTPKPLQPGSCGHKQGIKGLEKEIREDETIATAITMPQESLTKNKKKIII